MYLLKRSIRAEWQKLKRSKILLSLIILPILSILMGTGNFYMNQKVLEKEWISLWTQVIIFYGYFFFPSLIAVCCAYICRIEHLNGNWNAVMTIPRPESHIFLSKLIVVSALALFVQLFTVGLYLVSGTMLQFKSSVPYMLVGWVLRGWLGAIVISAGQLCLSMQIRSFSLPIGICMGLSVAGLMALLKGYGLYFPYAFISLGMGAVSQKGLGIYDNVIFAAMGLLFLFIFYKYGVWHLKRADVIT